MLSFLGVSYRAQPPARSILLSPNTNHGRFVHFTDERTYRIDAKIIVRREADLRDAPFFFEQFSTINSRSLRRSRFGHRWSDERAVITTSVTTAHLSDHRQLNLLGLSSLADTRHHRPFLNARGIIALRFRRGGDDARYLGSRIIRSLCGL